MTPADSGLRQRAPLQSTLAVIMPKTGPEGLAALLAVWRADTWAEALAGLGIKSPVALAEDLLTSDKPDGAAQTAILAKLRGADPNKKLDADDDVVKATIVRTSDRVHTGLAQRKQEEDAVALVDGAEKGDKARKAILKAERGRRYNTALQFLKLQRRRELPKKLHPSRKNVRLVGEALEESYQSGQPRLPEFDKLDLGYKDRTHKEAKEEKKKKKKKARADDDDESSSGDDAEELSARPFGEFWLATRALSAGGAAVAPASVKPGDADSTGLKDGTEAVTLSCTDAAATALYADFIRVAEERGIKSPEATREFAQLTWQAVDDALKAWNSVSATIEEVMAKGLPHDKVVAKPKAPKPPAAGKGADAVSTETHILRRDALCPRFHGATAHCDKGGACKFKHDGPARAEGARIVCRRLDGGSKGGGKGGGGRWTYDDDRGRDRARDDRSRDDRGRDDRGRDDRGRDTDRRSGR